jgi:hypothetical protein
VNAEVDKISSAQFVVQLSPTRRRQLHRYKGRLSFAVISFCKCIKPFRFMEKDNEPRELSFRILYSVRS